MEHTHSGNLAQYVAAKSLGSPGMGLSEDIARFGTGPFSSACELCCSKPPVKGMALGQL